MLVGNWRKFSPFSCFLRKLNNCYLLTHVRFFSGGAGKISICFKKLGAHRSGSFLVVEERSALARSDYRRAVWGLEGVVGARGQGELFHMKAVEGVLGRISLTLLKSLSLLPHPPLQSYFHVAIFKTANASLSLEAHLLEQRGAWVLACHRTAHHRDKCSCWQTLPVRMENAVVKGPLRGHGSGLGGP